jgi:hypothetical protein
VAIKYAMKALWGDWDGGSTIFFWSWPQDCFEGGCFGLSPWFVSDLPTSKDKQRKYTGPKMEHLEKNKIKKVINRDMSSKYLPS